MRALIPISFLLVVLVLTHLFYTYKLIDFHKFTENLKLDPLGLDKYQIKENTSTNVLLFGDSVMEYWQDFPDKTALNLGISGQTSEQILQRANYQLPYIKAKIAFISSGGNDIKVIASSPQEKDKIVENALNNLKQIIAQVNAESIVIVLPSRVFRIPLKYYLLDYKLAQRAQIEFNEKVKSLASERVKILDLYQMFETIDHRKQYSDDGIHLNPKGYQVVSQKIAPLLN